jgi:hypothetical protein
MVMDAEAIYRLLGQRFKGIEDALQKHGEAEAATDLDGLLWALASGQDKQLKVVDVHNADKVPA